MHNIWCDSFRPAAITIIFALSLEALFRRFKLGIRAVGYLDTDGFGGIFALKKDVDAKVDKLFLVSSLLEIVRGDDDWNLQAELAWLVLKVQLQRSAKSIWSIAPQAMTTGDQAGGRILPINTIYFVRGDLADICDGCGSNDIQVGPRACPDCAEVTGRCGY